MKSFSGLFALPIPLLALLSQAAAQDAAPVAIRKLSPDAGEKILAEHLAFSPVRALSPRVDVDISQFRERIDENVDGTLRYLPAFGRHYYHADDSVLRRAAEALAFLERRASCPSGTTSCTDVDRPNKCCQSGTYCVAVDDSSVGDVACCPSEASCGGGVGSCPSGSTSCSEELGGGCCIEGYVCQGQGCVSSISATGSSTASARSSTREQTRTTTSVEETTEASTTSDEAEMTTAETNTGSATGGAPLRPISSEVTTEAASTQTGCPTGYYGCLATHGGGCCRTDRDCNTYDCPAPSTTIVSGGATIVVLATDAPPVAAAATSTCASGWFLCGKDAGSVAGCCPTGYDCGTASCFTVTASQTGSVQKEFPEAADSAAAQNSPWMALGGAAAALCLIIGM